MTKISVLFQFTFVLFNCGIQAKSLVDGMKNERELQQDEIASQEPVFDNSAYPVSYGEGNGYSKEGPLYEMSNYRSEVMKRSLGEHSARQRQTGIIYGGGKPIGILQPYQESFKFMPIKEEHVYSLDGGRSSIDQQQPYINLMYPLARFTRSEDAIRMAELEAAKAEFLDKHYPSMLVDFKIHNKLHPTGYNAKAVPTFNLKREETNPTGNTNSNNNNELRKKKRESQSSSPPTQKLHKRENQHVQKRDSNAQKQSAQVTAPQKRETKTVEKREEKKVSTNEKRQADLEKTKMKVKRQSKLTDTEFQTLKNSVSKRNPNENIQVIEEDLKGLLSDMGLIEDDLEDNAEEMEESRSSVTQDEDLEEGFDTTAQKEKEEPQVQQKRDSATVPERKKREGDKEVDAQTSVPMSESRNSDSKKRTLNDMPEKRSVPETPDNGKRFIEVSFTTKDNKESVGGTNANEADTCPKPSVIPNKREAPSEKTASTKQERSVPTAEEKKVETKRSPEEPTAATTENYERYEQRVAREIKNKIKQLKEEVKRELGALEADKDEEDDDDSFGETQRKKRFIVNTLMDEETHNIDPNENLENSELEPHVRRRRTLSTDMMSYGPQKSPSGSYDKSGISEVNLMNFDPMSVVQNKFDFDVDGYYNNEMDGRSQSFQNPYGKEEITKKDVTHSKARTRKANDYNQYNDVSASRSYRWDDPSLYMKTPAKMYVPEYQRRKYVGVNSRRNLRNDLNADVSSYSADYENDASNSNSDEDAEASVASSVVDLTRKAAERKTDARQQFNEEHSPKKLQGYNQKYFYYYVGGNENEKKDNVAPSSANAQRSNAGYNYQRQYPNQFYKSVNRPQAKQYKENAKRAFQRRYDKPFGRRRKRYVNLMVPPKDKEDAVVSNVLYPNASFYPKFGGFGRPKFVFGGEKVKNASSDGTWSKAVEPVVEPVKEKGKNISTTNHDVPGQDPLVPWNSLMNYVSGISDERPKTPENTLSTNEAKEHKKKHDKKSLKKRKHSWHKRNYLNSLQSSNYIYPMPQLPQIEGGNTPLTQNQDKTINYEEKGKFNGRKMLSWHVHTNLAPEDNTRGPPASGNSNNTNSSGECSNDIDYQTEGDSEEYEDTYYVETEPTTTSKDGNVTTTTSTTQKPDNTTECPPEIPKETICIDEKNVTEKEKPHKTDPGTNSTNLAVTKATLVLQNENMLPPEWKRRKRDVQPEYRQNVRRKRSWFWPTLSFLHNSAPQIEEDEDFDQNDSPVSQDRQNFKRSGDQSAFSFEDEADGDGDGDFDEFSNDPSVYDRDKREVDSRPYFSGNKYYYTNKDGRGSYLPVSRNRRYVQGEFREPQQQLLTEISDAELFGALPQGYAGELARYKRVKRAEKTHDKT